MFDIFFDLILSINKEQEQLAAFGSNIPSSHCWSKQNAKWMRGEWIAKWMRQKRGPVGWE